MADINTEDLKAKAQEVLDGAGKAATDAAEAAKPVIDAAGKAAAGAAEAAKPVIDAAGKAVMDAADAAGKAAKPVIDEAGKKAQEAFDAASKAAKPVIDAAAEKVAPVVGGAAAAVAPVVDTVGAKAGEFAKSTGLDKTIDTVTHDAGVVVDAAKNKVEELTGRDLDGDGVIGAAKSVDEAEAEEAPAMKEGDVVESVTKAAADVATGTKNKIETLLNKDLDGDGKIG